MLLKSTSRSQDASGAMCIVCLSIALLSMHASGADASEPLECLIEPHTLVDVSSSEIGVLASVRVDEADVVRMGDAVAALHTDVERAVFEVSRARAQADSEIELLRRDHDFNVRKRDRVDELHDQKVVSAQDVDEVRTAQDAAWLRLQAAAERQRTARLEAQRDELALARRTVLSPIDGVVVRRYKSAGEFVDGDPIVQLAQLNPLRIRLVVPITMFGQIQVGMQATVLPELPIDGPFVASVTSIDPMMDAATATLGIRLSLPNPEHRLPPGLKCTLVMHPMEKPFPEAEKSTELNPESSSTQTVPNSGDELQLAAAVMSESAAGAVPVAPFAPQNTKPSLFVTEPTDSANMLPPETPSGESCVTLGPFQGTAVADTVAALLSASDINFERRIASDESAEGLWMVLSRQTYEEPGPLIKRLQEDGITDFLSLRHGAFKQRLSYGSYRSKQNAHNRLSKMQALGFDAELVLQRSTDSVLWLDLLGSPSDPMHSALMVSVREYYPKLLELPIACSQLAER